MADRQAIEEQTLPFYDQKQYYPVQPGEMLKDRYCTIAKLGYGAYSTVWLVWDEKAREYASLKVCVQTEENESSPVLNEINMLHRLEKFAEKDHPGLDCTRLARDIFEIDGNIPQRPVAVAHTDISSANIVMDIEDDTILKDVEQQETEYPSTPITTELSGHPWLTDFGQMRVVEGRINQDWWMSDLYRAPEVLLQLPWGYPVDIWSIGVMTLELLEGKNLVDPVYRVHGQYVLPLALAQYIGYLGPPPLEIIQKSPLFQTYFNSKGNWISEPPIPKTSLEEFVTTIPPRKRRTSF
ncbi:protein kinase [Aspergillus flavus]|uniref:Protein kinase n=1 Tax=Aspergillus flavus (strain ATCC 200026 / FGSC A1120 / IAM 13836 / NRRL 3357 / JCM 12722 / SRRC 167) TaxID=332952 RepID=A0A7U2MN17_ASPFN|nr:protein kinase [Aspergillus flavus]